MPEVISADTAQYAFDIVKTICTEVGPGLPGSSQEQDRAEILKNKLETHLGAGNVVTEEFTVAPGAFLGSQRMSATFTLVAAFLNISMGRLAGISPWITAILALVFSILPVFLFIFQFILADEIVDPFFKKKKSLNVIGTLRKPGTKVVKRLLILSGHHDSAWENNWLRWLGYGFFFASTTFLIGLVAMLAMSIIQLAGVITGDASIIRTGTLGWVILAYPIAPAIIFSMLFHRRGKTEDSCRARWTTSRPALFRLRCADSW